MPSSSSSGVPIAGQQAQAASSPSGGLVPFVPDATIHPTHSSAYPGGTVIRSSGAITNHLCLEIRDSPGNPPLTRIRRSRQGNGNSSLRGVSSWRYQTQPPPNHVSLAIRWRRPRQPRRIRSSRPRRRSNQDSTTSYLDATKAAGIGNAGDRHRSHRQSCSAAAMLQQLVCDRVRHFLLDPATTISGNSGLCVPPTSVRKPE